MIEIDVSFSKIYLCRNFLLKATADVWNAADIYKYY